MRDGTSDVGSSDLGADARARVDGDGAEDLRPRNDDDVIGEGRMALAADTVRGVGAAERDALIDRDIIADLGGLADHDAETMIDEEVPADLRARMDVDRGDRKRVVEGKSV